MGENNFSLSQIYLMDNNGNKFEIECNSVEYALSRKEKKTEEFNHSFKGVSGTLKLDKKSHLKLMKTLCKNSSFLKEGLYKYLKRCYNRDLLYKKRG